MNIKKFICGDIEENAYLVWEGKHGILIDPGTKARKLQMFLEENEIELDAILLTHAHFDHIGGVDFYAKQYQCDVYVSEEDYPMLYDASLNCSIMMDAFTCKTKAKTYKDSIHLIDKDIKILKAPGHTSGSVLLIIEDQMFSGDVLFKMGIGRTDLPGGSNTQMAQTIGMIKNIAEDFEVHPGHGDSTKLSFEQFNNPYFR